MTDESDRIMTATSMMKEGKIREALRLLLTSLEGNQNSARLNFYIAVCYDAMSREKRAVPYYERALNLGLPDDNKHDAILGLGSTLRITGDYERSIEVLTDGLEKFPESTYMRLFRSLALFDAGRGEASVYDLFEIVREKLLNPGDGFYNSIVNYFKEVARV